MGQQVVHCRDTRAQITVPRPPAAAGPLGGSPVSGYAQCGPGHVDMFLLGTCLRRKLQAPRVSCAQLRKCCRFSNLTEPTALRSASPHSLTWPCSPATTAGLRLLTTATAVPTSPWSLYSPPLWRAPEKLLGPPPEGTATRLRCGRTSTAPSLMNCFLLL